MQAIIIDLGKKLAEHLAYEAELIIQIQNANITFKEAKFLEECMHK